MGAVLTFLFGLFGLLVGGHFVVGNSSRIGVRLGLTPTIVGLTIVAAGTSAPELVGLPSALPLSRSQPASLFRGLNRSRPRLGSPSSSSG